MATVLVIDDRRVFRDRARLVLQREGLAVIEARDALAGLQRAVEDAPDVVLVAETLAGIGGLDVADRLAAEPATRHLPVLVATGRRNARWRRPLEEAARAFVSETHYASALLPPIRAWRRVATVGTLRAEVAPVAC